MVVVREAEIFVEKLISRKRRGGIDTVHQIKEFLVTKYRSVFTTMSNIYVAAFLNELYLQETSL